MMLTTLRGFGLLKMVDQTVPTGSPATASTRLVTRTAKMIARTGAASMSAVRRTSNLMP